MVSPAEMVLQTVKQRDVSATFMKNNSNSAQCGFGYSVIWLQFTNFLPLNKKHITTFRSSINNWGYLILGWEDNRENKKLMLQSHCDSKPREAKKFKDIG